jgi:hypothetical protein
MSFTPLEPLRSRRAVLTGAAAGAAAVAAQAIGSPAQAADGDPLILGEENSASTKTVLTVEAAGTSDAAVEVTNTGACGTGLVARSTRESGVGLIGMGGTTSVSGTSRHPNGPGVYGECNTGSSNDRGIVGRAAVGQGVAGYTDTGTGLFGTAFQGGKALEINGRAFFSRSGQLSIPAKKTSVIKTGVALTSESLVLATLQENIKGVWIKAAVPNVAENSFEIFLNKKPKRTVTVAWFIVN